MPLRLLTSQSQETYDKAGYRPGHNTSAIGYAAPNTDAAFVAFMRRNSLTVPSLSVSYPGLTFTGEPDYTAVTSLIDALSPPAR